MASHALQPTAGSRPGGDPLTHRGSVEYCEQRLIAQERVRFFAAGEVGHAEEARGVDVSEEGLKPS